ncbi:hypothetical protein ACLOJK_012041 [Asimina triloba]
MVSLWDKEIQSLQPPVDLWRKFIYCTSLSGYILGTVDHMQPQECTPSGVIVGATFLEEGKKQQRNIHCNILIGSDGAGSTVRKLVGIDMKGQRDLQKLVSIHFLSRDLGEYLLHQRPGMLFFIFNPEAIGVLVAHDLYKGENRESALDGWLALGRGSVYIQPCQFGLGQIPFYPPQQKIEDFNFQICEELISRLVGQKLPDVAVLDVKPWMMHAEVAGHFVSSDKQVILVGDAAHRFPPAGGFGMNTGIQDAHNLAWKIAFLLKGLASPSILQSYEMERRPIAIFNTELSIQNFKAAMSVPSALGLNPAIANSGKFTGDRFRVHRIINSSVGSILPSGLQTAVLEGLFTIGRAQLSPPLLNESNPLGSARLAKVRSIFDEGKSLQLQFPAEDLGFRYLEGALVPDIRNEVLDLTKAPSGRRKEYIPSSETGSHLPHMNIRILKALSCEAILSTLDLISVDKLEFVLVIAPLKESYDLAHAAFKVAAEFNVALKVCIIWPQDFSSLQTVGSKASLDPWENYVDVQEVKRVLSESSWWEMCQITNRGAILVRPDEHIAWRATDVIDNPVLEMDKAFSMILGINKTRCCQNDL